MTAAAWTEHRRGSDRALAKGRRPRAAIREVAATAILRLGARHSPPAVLVVQHSLGTIIMPLDLIEELRLRRWAREHYVPAEARRPDWAPVVLDEMQRRDVEEQQGLDSRAIGREMLDSVRLDRAQRLGPSGAPHFDRAQNPAAVNSLAGQVEELYYF